MCDKEWKTNMIFEEKEMYIGDMHIMLRNARTEDAASLIAYLKKTAGETPYLIRNPEEVSVTMESEINFIKSKEEAKDELMLLAFCNGKHVGNCSLMSMGNYQRYAHRCSVAIALYQEYCGRGIGTVMLETVLQVAKELGYEQAELEVAASNKNAIALYEKMGFQVYGTFPNNMKYQDGTYVDCHWMMKKL